MLEKFFGDDTMWQPQVFEYYQPYQGGREHVVYDASSWRPGTSLTDENLTKKIKEIVLNNGRITIRKVPIEI